MIRLHGLFGGLLLVLTAWANSSVAQHSQRIDSISKALQQPQPTAVRLKLNEKLAQFWLKNNQVEPALRLIDSTESPCWPPPSISPSSLAPGCTGNANSTIAPGGASN
jgi:hypothetical protein